MTFPPYKVCTEPKETQRASGGGPWEQLGRIMETAGRSPEAAEEEHGSSWRGPQEIAGEKMAAAGRTMGAAGGKTWEQLGRIMGAVGGA